MLAIVGIAKAQESPVHWKLSAKKITACEYDLVFDATIDEGWHLYSLNKVQTEDPPNPTAFTFKPSKNYETGGCREQSKPTVEFDKCMSYG